MISTPVSNIIRLAGAVLLAAGVACNTIAGVEDAELDPATATISLCGNSCELAYDGQCDDGGPDADSSECVIGSDCADCGKRSLTQMPGTYGSSCMGDADCSSEPDAYCARAGICTRTCTKHSDCGCASGIKDGDIAGGECQAQCLPVSDDADEGYCYRTCYGDAQCSGASHCQLSPGMGACVVD